MVNKRVAVDDKSTTVEELDAMVIHPFWQCEV